MINVTGISHFGLEVENLARAEHFYTEALGGTIDMRHEGDSPHIMVMLAGHGLTIFQRKAGETRSAETTPRGVHFAFKADPEEMDQNLAHLESHGVELDGPHGHRGGESPNLSWYFEDPDGYRLEFSITYPSPEAAREELKRRGGRQNARGRLHRPEAPEPA